MRPGPRPTQLEKCDPQLDKDDVNCGFSLFISAFSGKKYYQAGV